MEKQKRKPINLYHVLRFASLFLAPLLWIVILSAWPEHVGKTVSLFIGVTVSFFFYVILKEFATDVFRFLWDMTSPDRED